MCHVILRATAASSHILHRIASIMLSGNPTCTSQRLTLLRGAVPDISTICQWQMHMHEKNTLSTEILIKPENLSLSINGELKFDGVFRFVEPWTICHLRWLKVDYWALDVLTYEFALNDAFDFPHLEDHNSEFVNMSDCCIEFTLPKSLPLTRESQLEI